MNFIVEHMEDRERMLTPPDKVSFFPLSDNLNQISSICPRTTVKSKANKAYSHPRETYSQFRAISSICFGYVFKLLSVINISYR